jgi:aminomethyltransferase
MSAGKFVFKNIELVISRSGYTGEDGFEISLPNDCAADFAKRLLAEDEVDLIGLGARDSLRLEAGLCLYGQDIDTTTTPVEAGLEWLIAGKGHDTSEIDNFPGAGKIREQLRNGAGRRRVGLKPLTKAPLRSGIGLLNEKREQVGTITSGGYSPSLKGPIAMGYVRSDYTRPGMILNTCVRGKEYDIEVVKLPFVEHHYNY